jgi:hypothetical protein
MLRRLILLALVSLPCAGRAAELPRILASADNQVPRCVEPASLMEFVNARNARLHTPREIDPRFDAIASLYQKLGACVSRDPAQCVAIRWDYAFYQMLLETNFLTFRRPDGKRGGVRAEDNNFAGVGATVPGKPGEKFKDVKTGVLAHLQHVLMYSLTPIPHPVAQRTRQVQSDVQDALRRLHRPITFNDLARIWTGTDHSRYVRDIQKIAAEYTGHYCEPQLVADSNK